MPRPVSDATRAKLGEASQRRHKAARAVVARRLKDLGKLSDRQAAAALGVAALTVRRAREEHGLPRPDSRLPEVSRRRAELRREQLAVDLAGLGALTSAEAARVLGCSRHLVLRVRKEFGLPAPRQVRADSGWRTDRSEQESPR